MQYMKKHKEVRFYCLRSHFIVVEKTWCQKRLHLWQLEYEASVSTVFPDRKLKIMFILGFLCPLLIQSSTPHQGWCHKHLGYPFLPHLKCSEIILTYNPDTCIQGDSKLRQANDKDQLL